MIDRFIAHLRRLDPEATPSEIADILWLAARMGEAGGDAGQRPGSSETAEKEKPGPEDSAPGNREAGEAEEPRESTASMYPRTAAGTGLGGAGGLGGEAIGSPGVPALPGRLELVRALRPLKRRVASRRFREVDIRATAERMAETRLPWPVTRPVPERWLDLILVEEASPTMRIWRPVVRELARLLRGAGVFRRVVRRKMALGSMEDGGKCSSSAGRLGVATAPERTLVLVVSDGVSAPWWNGEAARILERWGRTAMTALVQMFPEHLWDRNGLGRAEKVRIRFPFPGASGRSVFAIRPFAGFDSDEPEDDEVQTGMANPPAVLPVFPLEAAYVRDWATALSGTGTFPPVGFLLESTVWEDETEAENGEGESPDLDARIRRFLSISSPTSRRLCGYLAAVPLVFPVMRLVQGVMLPDSRQHHLAEVMLSGLVYRMTPRGEDKPDDEILYDFLEGARERLVGLNRIDDTLDVMAVANEKVRAFLDEKTGRAVDFRALVGAPEGSGVSIGKDELGFAQISATVLGRMGGRYKQIAQHFKEVAQNLKRKPEKNNPDFNFEKKINKSTLPKTPTKRTEKKAIVRILKGPDGEEPAGAGVLVAEDTVMTCDQVVDMALANGVVHLDFPLLAPGKEVRFRVTRRFPLNDNVFFGEPDDLAVLKILPGETLPDGALSARFLAETQDDHPVKLCGFPEGRERGDWAYGELVGPTGEGWIQLDHDLASRLVAPGFSGTAAWVRPARVAAGIVVSRHMRDGQTSAFVIPSAILRKACEEVRFDEKVIRVYELAQDLKMKPNALLEKIQDMGIVVRSHASALDYATVEKIISHLRLEGASAAIYEEFDPEKNANVGVFISYAKEDVKHAKRLYEDLKKADFSPWLDVEELLPGQNWRDEISQAVLESRYFVALLSKRGLSRNGFVHREMKKALEIMEDYPEGHVFLIPARLDDCQPQNEKLSKLHWVDLFPDYEAGFEKIRRALEFQRRRDEAESLQKDDEPWVEVLDPVEDSKKKPKTETAEPSTKFTNSLGMDFVWIPSGTFMMGSPEDEPGRWDNESPHHRVRITHGFYMQTTPVTQGQWEAIAGENPSAFKRVSPDAPVENVSWEDVRRFIEKLNSKADSPRFRLPTEAEWEYACRAGTETAFYNGPIKKITGLEPNLIEVGWFDKNSRSRTQPVAKKLPNSWGLYDMHGNVWEWCSDWLNEKYYAKSPLENPQGPDRGTFRVCRGGAWNSSARRCRAACRRRRMPIDAMNDTGFRLLGDQQTKGQSRVA